MIPETVHDVEEIKHQGNNGADRHTATPPNKMFVWRSSASEAVVSGLPVGYHHFKHASILLQRQRREKTNL
jgi:hypothetical protein